MGRTCYYLLQKQCMWGLTMVLFQLLSYFSWLLCLRCLLHRILTLIAYTFRENRDFVFIIIAQFILLSSLCKLIGRHWTYKMPVRYILSSVWMRFSIFSQLSIIQYMVLCVFSFPISLVMIGRIYTLSYYHRQIGSMNYCHCLELGHETMVCAVSLSIFFFLITVYR